jgi:hypothetical protein
MEIEDRIEQAAQWMAERARSANGLYQLTAVGEISRLFGDDLTYYTQMGVLSIDKRVLARFRKLTERDVVWSRLGKYWRTRKADDGPGRQAAFY